MDQRLHERALQVFQEVTAFPVADQYDAANRLCGQETELLTAVEGILQASRSADAGANETRDVAEQLDIRSSAYRFAAIQEQAGSHIGPYKLLQLIGEGGFGSVFLAEQARPVQRRVALKIIKLGMDTRQVVARFEQERQALAMMDHANIAKVFDAGATSTGRPYFVMELCKGVPITDYCDRHNLSIPDRLALFVQACHAVQHAHQKGLIQRDIKPSNILVSEEEGHRIAKVIDFGIAKATASKLTEKTVFTQREQMIGTPAYMSPEQADGSFDIDTRTDVYALGVLLYELLTGSTPVDMKALREAGFDEIRRVIREVEPPVPSSRVSRGSDTLLVTAAKRQIEARKLSVMLRGDLDWIVMRALEKERTRRYDTAKGIALDIGRHLAGQPVVAAPPGAGYRISKFVRRNRAIVSAGALVAGALLVSLAVFVWQAMEVREQRDKAVIAQKSEAILRITAEKERTTARTAADKAERAAYQAQIVSASMAIEDHRSDAARALLAAASPRLRGWEYRHLVSLNEYALPSPFPVDWLVSDVVPSANSRRVVVRRSAAGGPFQWVVLDGDLSNPLLVVPDTSSPSFSLSPDGTRAVWTPFNDIAGRPAVLWDIESKSVLATIPLEHDPDSNLTLVVTWTPTGDRFMISHPSGYQIHDGRTGSRLASDQAQGYMYFTGDPRWALFQSYHRDNGFKDRDLRLLDARSLKPVGEIFHFDLPVTQYAFRPSRLVCGLEDGTCLFLEIDDRGVARERSRINAGISNLDAMAWSATGDLLAIGSKTSGHVRVWDAASGVLRCELDGPESGVQSQWFMPDSDDLCVCDMTGHPRVLPLHPGDHGVLTAHKSYVYPAVVSKDGGMLLTGGWDGFAGLPGGLKLWDARTGTLVSEYGKPGEIFVSADLTPDQRYAVVAIKTIPETNFRTEVIDLVTGAIQTAFRPPATQSAPAGVVALRDGRRVLSTYVSGEVYVWDLMTGKVLWSPKRQPHGEPWMLSGAAASPDGHLIAFADHQTGIRLVNADDYSNVRCWDAHTDTIWATSFSADGKWLLSASDDQTVGVWDVATGSPIACLKGHGTKVLCVAMSPDGTRIATGGRDGIVNLWDTTHFENVAQLRGHTDYIFCLAWSPDGQQLFSTSGDSTVRMWDTRTLAEQVAATRDRSEALPRLESLIAQTQIGAVDNSVSLRSTLASPKLTAREREFARQIVARQALQSLAANRPTPVAKPPG
jgi:WD40 repeat protein